MSFWKWSRTAANNATADGSINWAEGQAPSTASDSARAMMAAASKYRDDVAGAIATAGTGTAYTLSAYQVFDTLARRDFARARAAAADDMAHVLHSGGMGEDDIRAWKDALESSASADEARPPPARNSATTDPVCSLPQTKSRPAGIWSLLISGRRRTSPQPAGGRGERPARTGRKGIPPLPQRNERNRRFRDGTSHRPKA
jgi:hypothetical protein